MSMPRRRIIRPVPAPMPSSLERPLRLQKLRGRLEQERAALARWMSRLKRAFHAVEKSQQRIARLERQITWREE
jgi:hypothetical protein